MKPLNPGELGTRGMLNCGKISFLTAESFPIRTGFTVRYSLHVFLNLRGVHLKCIKSADLI